MNDDQYDVEVSREAGYWVAVVHGVRGGATESRRLSALDSEVRDLLSGLLDIDADSLGLTWNYEPALGPAASKRVTEYGVARDDLGQAQEAYDRAQRLAVDELRTADVSLRDSATLLGMSFQRVQQLVHA
jgi:hypothetical protein